MSKNNRRKKDQELIELGRKLQSFYDMGYVSKKSALYFSFVKGLASGAGAFIGGTVVIGLLLWVLGLFNQAPIVGHFIDTIQDSLK